MKKIITLIVTITLATFIMMKAENTLNVNKQMILSNLDALAEQESNNEGSGKFFYKHLLGQPKDCIMYKHVKVDGSVKYTGEEVDLGAEWSVSRIDGVKEKCPKKGDGCTVYECSSTKE